MTCNSICSCILVREFNSSQCCRLSFLIAQDIEIVLQKMKKRRENIKQSVSLQIRLKSAISVYEIPVVDLEHLSAHLYKSAVRYQDARYALEKLFMLSFSLLFIIHLKSLSSRQDYFYAKSLRKRELITNTST